MKPDILKDFVYLDWERVRSFTAQLFEGLPEEKSRQHSSEVAASGGLSGDLLFMQGKAKTDLRYVRTENETQSLHHYVYSIWERRLDELSLFTKIDSDFDMETWAPGGFRDGDFIRVVGRVRFIDFEWMSTMLSEIPNMMRTIHHLTHHSAKTDQRLSPGQLKEMHKEQQTQLREIEGMKLERLTKLVHQIYGNVVRVKVVPNEHHTKHILVGTALPSLFYEPPISLANRYGTDIDASWTVVGQISSTDATDNPTPLPVGNPMEDAFEEVAFSLTNLLRIASAPRFPAISFTPISIYRTVESQK